MMLFTSLGSWGELVPRGHKCDGGVKMTTPTLLSIDDNDDPLVQAVDCWAGSSCGALSQ